ncbi:MAG: hypothetical protein F6K28_42155 [Microcoleus sp. SIO2G3]|nr:hypothetical protein [Microcoleus sp. SIO2G3]
MTSDFDYPTNKDLLAPVVFRSDFNNGEPITATQAWSLFFTVGQEDKALGFERELGRFFTNLLIAAGVTGTVWALIFSNLA